MAVSRPLLFALAGVVVLFAAVTGMRVVGGGEDPAPASLPTSTATSSSSATPAGATTGGSSAASSSGAPNRRADDPGQRSRRSSRSEAGIPDRVARSLAERKVVVLFFGARGADGRETRKSARAVRGGDVAVFTDTVWQLDEYARLIGALPISQIPATVIIDRERQARVVQGFADAGTLRQLVADVR